MTTVMMMTMTRIEATAYGSKAFRFDDQRLARLNGSVSWNDAVLIANRTVVVYSADGVHM